MPTLNRTAGTAAGAPAFRAGTPSYKELCMADERMEPRAIDFRQWLPWTHLFRGFRIAFDYKKLLLAAAGILVMAVGWWFWSTLFLTARKGPPQWPTDYKLADYQPKDVSEAEAEPIAKKNAWQAFKRDRDSWNLFYKAAGTEPRPQDAGDLAQSPAEYDDIQKSPAYTKIENRLTDKDLPAEARADVPPQERTFEVNGKTYVVELKPYGKLCTWPWFEDRGPNPFLLVTGRTGDPQATGREHFVPWKRGEFFDWFLGDEVPVLIEPLVKFLRPVFYILSPHAGFVDRLYFLLVILWTVATWAIFGGAITRIAAVQVARNEKISLGEALRFTLARWRSYLFASFAPLGLLAGLEILLILFGLLNLVPVLAELWNGLFWLIPLGVGFIMAVVLVCLVGWPMIQATLGAEGSDSFDALSRSYSYVLQNPWSYLWYSVVALVYGAVVVFFVGFMGSLMVYLAKWGVSQTPGTAYFNRDPSYMFVWAPTSFGWRDLLLQGSPIVGGNPTVSDAAMRDYFRQWQPWNNIGLFLVTIWLYLVFLLVVGFGYSYFWSASTIIYFLMRRKVDDTEMDEVYLEEEDTEEPYSAPTTPASTPATTGAPLQMVEPPALRPTPPPGTSAPAPVESTAPSPGEGNASPGGTSAP
jgi:hypothetical protein